MSAPSFAFGAPSGVGDRRGAVGSDAVAAHGGRVAVAGAALEGGPAAVAVTGQPGGRGWTQGPLAPSPEDRARWTRLRGPVLVTGGAGVIGRRVVAALQAARLPFVSIVRPAQPSAASHAAVAAALPAVRALGQVALRGEGHEVSPPITLELDLREREPLAALLEALAPATVLNLAGVGLDPGRPPSAEALSAINVELPVRLLGGLAPGGVLVQAGSVSEYEAGASDEPLDERLSRHEGRTPYAASKVEADRRLSAAVAQRADGRRCLRARIAWTVGGGERSGRLLPSIVAAARQGRPVELTDGLQRRDLLHAHDVARALLLLAATPGASEAVNVGRGRAVTVRAVAERAAARLGCLELLRFGARPLRPGEPASLVPDVGRLARTGFAPSLSLEASIDRAVDELCEEVR